MPLESPTAMVRPAGSTSMALRASPSPRMTPTAAGLRRSAASRLSRVAGVSSRATPWRASRSERSSAASLAASRAEPLRLCGLRLLPRPVLPVQRGQRRPAGEHHEGEHAGEHEPYPAAGALARGLPGVKERVLGGVELGLVRAAPLERGRQPPTAVELARVAAAGVPVARRLGELPLQAPALGVLLEPAAQTRPLAQQRFVGDLDRSGAHRQQPALGEDVEDPRDALAALRLELVQRDAAADDRSVLTLVGEAEQERARDLPLRRLEAAEGVLGQPRDRALDAARAAVGGELQLAAAALPPQLEQRRRQERERTGLARDVLDERVLELGLDAQPTRSAGRVIARRSSSRAIGPTSTWFAPTRRASSGNSAQRA